MTHRLLLKISAVIAMLFGLALVFGPNQLLEIYRVPPMNPQGVYNSMLFGGALLGIAFMNWTASDATTWDEVHYVMVGNLAVFGIGFLVAIIRQLTSESSLPSGWVNVAIYLVFACAFGYVYLVEHTDSSALTRPPLHG